MRTTPPADPLATVASPEELAALLPRTRRVLAAIAARNLGDGEPLDPPRAARERAALMHLGELTLWASVLGLERGLVRALAPLAPLTARLEARAFGVSVEEARRSREVFTALADRIRGPDHPFVRFHRAQAWRFDLLYLGLGLATCGSSLVLLGIPWMIAKHRAGHAAHAGRWHRLPLVGGYIARGYPAAS